MYGLVLMTALATGGATPTYHDGVGCYGGGCYASSCGGVVVSAGCYGSGCYSSGCYGSCNGCSGCYGGGLFSRHRSSFGSRSISLFGCRGSSCTGCCGGYYGVSCYGGSCYGSGAYYYGSDFHGGWSGCYGSAPVYGCHGGCTGLIVGSAWSFDGVPYVSIPAASKDFQAATTKPGAAPARLTIEVPADAKLFVDGQLTKGEGTTRNFHTPELPKDQTFFYDLKAEVVVDGVPVTETKRVLVRSGEVLTEAFSTLLVAGKASKTPAVLVAK